MKKTIFILTAGILLFLPMIPGESLNRSVSSLWSIQLENIQMQTYINSLETAEEPVRMGSNLIITYSAPEKTRYVGVVFSHEEYRTIHTLYRNTNGVYFLIAELPETNTEILYRIVVDGIWGIDPNNRDTVHDTWGNRMSRYEITREKQRYLESPIYHQDGTLEFIYKSHNNIPIYLVGSFNHWDPFQYQLTEHTPGIYSIRLRIPPGTHYYAYSVRGRYLFDPMNGNYLYNESNQKISYFTID